MQHASTEHPLQLVQTLCVVGDKSHLQSRFMLLLCPAEVCSWMGRLWTDLSMTCVEDHRCSGVELVAKTPQDAVVFVSVGLRLGSTIDKMVED